ncbi:hypothetical protein ENBRE01_1208 [Enteropsectra breve]|nr:hypothetical protein ENBRE01_1208 [Enteropsectra breve]
MNYDETQNYNTFATNFMHNYSKSVNPYYSDGDYTGPSAAESPFINPKQAYWIRKRRLRREMLDAIMVEQKNGYLHESRHKHAMKRMRAPSGRFLTKEETQLALQRQNEDDSSGFEM